MNTLIEEELENMEKSKKSGLQVRFDIFEDLCSRSLYNSFSQGMRY